MRFFIEHVAEFSVAIFLLVINFVGLHMYLTTGRLPDWFYLSAGNVIGAAVAFRFPKPSQKEKKDDQQTKPE